MGQNKWIKMSEQLPPEPELNSFGEWYICTVVNNQVVPMRYVKEIVRGKEALRWLWQSRLSTWEPIAWMPFPEPYVEGGNKDV